MSRDGGRAGDKGTARVPRNNDKRVSRTLSLNLILVIRVVSAQNAHVSLLCHSRIVKYGILETYSSNVVDHVRQTLGIGLLSSRQLGFM